MEAIDKLTKTKNYKEAEIKVKELKLNTYNLELEEGTSFNLNVIVLPNNSTNKKVIWSSNNSQIATVSEDGLVKAVGSGKTSIVVKTEDGDVEAKCDLVVNKKKP